MDILLVLKSLLFNTLLEKVKRWDSAPSIYCDVEDRLGFTVNNLLQD